MTYDPHNPHNPQQPMYGYGYPQPLPRSQTNAILALVLSCVGLATCGVTAIVGVIFGHIALGKIRRGEEDGRSMALAGVIIGYVFIVGWLLYAAIIVIAIIAAANQGTY